MTAQMPASAQEHYENLLEDHYEWMCGLPFEAKVAEQKTTLDEFVGKDLAGGLAGDIGCGSGFQSVALSDRRYKVLAIDTSEKLLRHLSARVGSRNIVTKHADLRELDSLVSPASVEIAVCMGDTLTHLSSRSEVSNFWLLVGRLPCRQLFEPASLFCIAIEECMMKAISYNLSFAALVAALLLSLTGQSALAQAPTAPQGGAPPPQQQQRNPAPQKAPGAAQQPPQAGVTIAVDVPIVTLDVVATTQHGDILTGLKKENFRVIDDGVPQTITNFAPTNEPITMVVLMQFSGNAYGWFANYAKYWADALFPNLQPKDWVALETFDIKTRLEVDFTQNKDEVRNAIYHLYFPGFSESNVFDAILETTERLKDVKGKKSILVLASGVDTFSKHTLDQTMKQLRGTDVTIFCVGLGKTWTNYLETHGYRGSNLNYLQAENQLRTFSQETGGYAWFPQFDGEVPGIFRDVAAILRHQYSLSYSPANGVKDGKFHKIKVELVAPDGGPLTVLDQKGKKQKYQVYAREGYQAPKGKLATE